MRTLLAFQVSPASARIALIKSVDSRNPRACNVSTTGRTADNKPCRLARTRMPAVPVTANPKFFAAALAGKSSIKRRHGARKFDAARSMLSSPASKNENVGSSHSRLSGVNHLARSAWRISASPGNACSRPGATSAKTIAVVLTFSNRAFSSGSWPATPRAISGLASARTIGRATRPKFRGLHVAWSNRLS